MRKHSLILDEIIYNMPTKIIKHFFIFSLMVCLTQVSCKKDIKATINEEHNLVQEIKEWLDTQRQFSQPNKSKKIELLKINLDFSKISVDTFINGDQLVLIPIDKSFLQTSNLDKNSIITLVLINDKSNVIKNGRIAIFTPNKNEPINQIEKNTFSNVLQLAPIKYNGTFIFLSVSGKLLNKFVYKNGQILSFGEVRTKQQNDIRIKSNSLSGSNCTDWYIVTTYYLDGIPVYQDSQFIGTTCEGCDDPDLQSLCPDDEGIGGGGGLGEADVITTTTVTSTKSENDETDGLVGRAPKIDYRYVSSIERTNGYVSRVIVYPTTISNMYEAYIDRYGRSTTRILTVFGHNNSWTSLGATAMIYHSCFVYGRWIYSSSPEYNRTWFNAHTDVK